MEKICNTCNVSKLITEFKKDSRVKCGYAPLCKSCQNEYDRQYYKEKHRDKKISAQKAYYASNSESILRRQNIIGKTEKGKLKVALKNLKSKEESKGTSLKRCLGYSFNEAYLFFGRGLKQGESIDHKIPKSWFIKETPSSKRNDLRNLHIIPMTENQRKKNSFCHAIPKDYFTEISCYLKEEYINKVKTND